MPRYEIGANVSDAGNIAIEGFYGFSHTGARWDFAIRGGVQDNGDCDGCKAGLLIGLDARYRVIDQSDDFPLDGALITGAGAHLVSGGSRLFIPIGLSLGRRVQFENSNSSLVPYVEPVIIPTFGDGDSDVGVALALRVFEGPILEGTEGALVRPGGSEERPEQRSMQGIRVATQVECLGIQ